MDNPRKQKQEQIADKLMEEIHSGRWTKGDKLPSEGEIADRFMVNKLTANKAIGILVGKDYCRRSSGRGGTVVTWQEGGFKGIIGCFQGNQNSYFHAITRGIESVIHQRNYLMAYFIKLVNLSGISVEQQLARSEIKGLISVQANFGDLPFPLIVVDGSVPTKEKFNYITCDNEGSGRLQAQHLLKMGHREIVYVSHIAGVMAVSPRTIGFRATLAEAGLKDIDDRFFINSFESLRSPVVLDRILSRWPGVTAIGFDNDPAAAHAIWMLMNRGIKVPQDISVIGMGPVHEAYNHPLRLTSIDAHPFEMGERAAQLMIDCIEGRRKSPIAEILPTHLIPGETVAVRQVKHSTAE